MRVSFFAQLLPVPLDPLFVAADEVLPKPMRLLREAHLVAGLLFEQRAARQMIFSLPTGRPLAVTHLYTAASIQLTFGVTEGHGHQLCIAKTAGVGVSPLLTGLAQVSQRRHQALGTTRLFHDLIPEAQLINQVVGQAGRTTYSMLASAASLQVAVDQCHERDRQMVWSHACPCAACLLLPRPPQESRQDAFSEEGMVS